MNMKVLYLDQDTHPLFLLQLTSNEVVILLALITNSADSIIKSGVCPATITHYSPIFCRILTTFKSREPDEPVKKMTIIKLT